MTGLTISQYRVLAPLGSGGSNAEELELGRLAAIQFLPSELARDRLALERRQRRRESCGSTGPDWIGVTEEPG